MAAPASNKQLNLLKNIVQYQETVHLKADLEKIEKLIFTRLPETLAQNAPQNFPELYFDFKQEYERFKAFILYDKLIGRNVVALGGGFSTGKSTFLNSILGQEILPSSIRPSTSVPAYLVHGEENEVHGINTFGAKVNMELADVMLLAHGFGQEDGGEEVTLGHLLSSLFISAPNQPFSHIALLDTPGYSKANTSGYSSKTDEKIARTQLNSSNFILWFVQAEAGTITDEDITFIKTLKPEIPKLIIVNKADKVMPDELDEIIDKIRDILKAKIVPVVDILAYSSDEPEEYDKDKILKYLKKWDNAVPESMFAYNFKVLFTQCQEYYEALLLERRKYLSRVNKSIGFTDDNFVLTFLKELLIECRNKIKNIQNMLDTLHQLQNEFFYEMHQIASSVGISMPVPTEIDLLAQRLA